MDGFIYIAAHARIIHFFKEELSVPAVIACAYTDFPFMPSVVIEDEQGGYDIMKYVLSMGHSRIGIIGGHANSIHTKKRLLGAQKAMCEAEVLYNPDWVFYGTWDRDSGYELAKPLIEAGVTAIFCMSDHMAGGVYDYLEECGLKAGVDVSVAGFNNQDEAEYFRPALTTMALPLYEIGYKSAEILLKEIDGERDIVCGGMTEEIETPCSLVIRKSVGKVKS